MASSSQVIAEYCKQNIFARDTPPKLIENYTSYPKKAEKTNGRWTMICIPTLICAYATRRPIFSVFFLLEKNLD